MLRGAESLLMEPRLSAMGDSFLTEAHLSDMGDSRRVDPRWSDAGEWSMFSAILGRRDAVLVELCRRWQVLLVPSIGGEVTGLLVGLLAGLKR